MKLREAKEILRKHNKWRRDKTVPSKLKMQDPTQLGIAIDTILNYLDNSGYY